MQNWYSLKKQFAYIYWFEVLTDFANMIGMVLTKNAKSLSTHHCVDEVNEDCTKPFLNTSRAKFFLEHTNNK